MKTSTNAEIWLPRMMDVIWPEEENSFSEQKERSDGIRKREKERAKSNEKTTQTIGIDEGSTCAED